MSKIIEAIKTCIPQSLLRSAKVLYYSVVLLPEYIYWFFFDLRQNKLFSTEKSIMAGLMITCHVLEKGLTMPNRKMGFGYDKVRNIIYRCENAINKYSEDHIEIQSCLNDLEQYLQMHKQSNFELPADICQGIENLLKYKRIDTIACFESTPTNFFIETNDFKEFAHSRHSVRWYSNENIDKETLIKSVELAQTAPSACNRQSVKVYVIESDKMKEKVLKLQNGNRGFGHLANKILLVTSDMKCWSYDTRTMAYIDAGIFVQNLLYALHYNKICACTLNAGLTICERKKLREIVGYLPSEIPMVFISIGKAPDRFMVAGSQRVNTADIYKFV